MANLVFRKVIITTYPLLNTSLGVAPAVYTSSMFWKILFRSVVLNFDGDDAMADGRSVLHPGASGSMCIVHHFM